MSFITHPEEPNVKKEGPPATNETDADQRAKARQQRVAALRRVAGIWADRTDIPADGLKYERELRDEWR
jgi:hypothetical protein